MNETFRGSIAVSHSHNDSSPALRENEALRMGSTVTLEGTYSFGDKELNHFVLRMLQGVGGPW